MATSQEIGYLKEIAQRLRFQSLSGCITASSSVVSDPQTIPARLSSITIVKTATNSTLLTFSNATTYQLTQAGETLVISANPGGNLPSFTIAGGSYKWVALK